MTPTVGSAALMLSPLQAQAAWDWQRAHAHEPSGDAGAAVAAALARVSEGPLATLEALWETARGLGAASCLWVAEPGGRVLAAHGLPAPWPATEAEAAAPRDALRLPVLTDGRVSGALHLRSTRPDGFSSAEVSLLASLSAVLGHATARQADPAPTLDDSIVDRLPGPVMVLAADGTLVRLNRAASALVGVEPVEALGRPWGELLGRVSFGADLGCLIAGDEPLAQTSGVRLAATDGEGARRVYLWRVWQGQPRAPQDQPTVLYAVDITDQSRLERELREADRLIMAGQLATGLAHELRNPLSAIQGFGELLQQQVGAGVGAEHLQLLAAQARRAEGIVSQLLGFATPVDARRQPVDVNELVHGTLSLLSYQLRRARVEVALALRDDLPAVAGNATELQQVLVNLLVNAQHALAGVAGARVTLTTGIAGDQVQIAVVDNGPGIAPSVLERIFQPFVSTKPEGMGTGLGLSICAGIMEQHRGSIAARNRPEGGAELTVRLPLGSEPSAPLRPLSPDVPEAPRALVVDDDEAIQALLCAVLTDAGLQVQVAGDGHAALEQLGACTPHVVVCDVNMPGMTGRELYETLLDQSPETARRMVFTTGSVAGDALCDFAHECGNPVLTKPFPLRALLSAVSSVLER